MEQKKICESELTEKEIYDSLIGMENSKSNQYGLTKQFYCTFWNEIKNIFMNSLRESKILDILSTLTLGIIAVYYLEFRSFSANFSRVN